MKYRCNGNTEVLNKAIRIRSYKMVSIVKSSHIVSSLNIVDILARFCDNKLLGHLNYHDWVKELDLSSNSLCNVKGMKQ
jgi:hypothetical protein